jgi:hypothetical protein
MPSCEYRSTFAGNSWEPGLWTDGWEPCVDPQDINNRLDDQDNFLHLEMVMFGRSAKCDQPDLFDNPPLVPGWQETNGDSVLINGRPLNGLPIEPTRGPDAVPSRVVVLHDEDPVGFTLRVTGSLVLDVGHSTGDDTQEIHPIYAIGGASGCRQPIQKSEDGLDRAVVLQNCDVKTGYRRLRARRTQFPAEPALLVMAVDRASEAERKVRKLLLHGRDGGVDLSMPLSGCDGIDIPTVLGPELVDCRPAGSRIRLVPNVDVAGSDLFKSTHGQYSFRVASIALGNPGTDSETWSAEDRLPRR